MKAVIKDGKVIREFQKEFSGEFPYLKIEFFDLPYTPKAPTPKSKMYNAERKLGLCRKLHVEGVVDLSGQRTVAELEKELWEKYGLSAQVFRKLGKLWIETNLTDNWSLERQNKEGHELRFDNPNSSENTDDPNDRDAWR